MKKLLTLCAATFLAVSLTGCENETPEKLLGHTLYNPSQANESAAKSAQLSADMVSSMGDYAVGFDSIIGTSRLSASEISEQLDTIRGPDNEGFFVLEFEGDSFAARWLYEENDPIVIDSGSVLDNLEATINEAEEGNDQAKARFFQIKVTLDSVENTAGLDLPSVYIDYLFRLNTKGDLNLSDGATINGNIEGTTTGGLYFECTLNSIVLDTDTGITGGDLSIDSQIGNISYETELSFNSSGEGEGTITSSRGYKAEVYIDTATGEGYYKDSGGKYEFS